MSKKLAGILAAVIVTVTMSPLAPVANAGATVARVVVVGGR